MPLGALFCNKDKIPGILTNRYQAPQDKRKFKTLIDEIRGQVSFPLTLKETRQVNLVRLRIRYQNIDEQYLLDKLRKMNEEWFSTKDEKNFDPRKLKIEIKQRKLNIRMHNTWKDIGDVRSINLAAPQQESEFEQICEACANIRID